MSYRLNTPRKALIFWGFIAALGLLSAAPLPAQANAKEGEKLLKKGRALLKKGDYKEAVIVLMSAQATAPSPLIRLEIAAAYEGLDDPVRAAEIYQALSDDPGLFGKPKKRCRQRLEAVQQKVGRLTIESRLKDALVEVGDSEVGGTPLPGPVYVEPGDVKITVSTAAESETRTVEIAAGESKTVRFDFRDRPAKAAPDRPMDPLARPVPDEPPPRRERRPAPTAVAKESGGGGGGFPPTIMGRRWTWVAAAGAAVTAIVGMGVGISAHVDYARYKDDTTPSSDYPDLESGISAKSTAANVMFGLAGGLAVTAVVLYLVEGPSSAGERAQAPSGGRWLVVGPTGDGSGGQLGLGTTF